MCSTDNLLKIMGQSFFAWAIVNFNEGNNKTMFNDFIAKNPNEIKYCTQTLFKEKLTAYSTYQEYKKQLSTLIPENNMKNNQIENVSLSTEASDFIKLLREDDNSGLHGQIEVMEQLLIEFVRDETMGEDNNRKYMRYLADVIELTRALLPG